MQYSIVKLAKAKEKYDFRIDSEYYHPKFLDLEKRLGETATVILEDVACKVSDGTHFTPTYYDSGIPFLSAINIQENRLDLTKNFQYISPKEHSLLYRRSDPKANDILVRKVGVGPRWACVVPEGVQEFSIFVSVAQIRCQPGKINQFFLSTFINSRYGQEQLLRFNKGISQPDLHLEDICRLVIPMVSDTFQRVIERICLSSRKLTNETEDLYRESERILLFELGLLDWNPRHKLAFVGNYVDILSANRIDAEYFQPMYDELVEKVKQYRNGHKQLGKCVKIEDKNFLPKDDVSYKYIELANISANGNINGFIEAKGKELPTRARRKVNTGDLIVSSIEGSLSCIALITDDLNNALCSTGFYVINSDRLNSETLLVLLKSPVGQLQLKKGCSGTILTAIGNNEFKNVILPDVASKTQEDIKQKVTDMYKSKALSKSLLEIAKNGVEMAIETNEEEAQNWINQEVKSYA